MNLRKALFVLLFISFFIKSYSQDKKVAVVTFYADKRIGMKDLGLDMGADMLKLDKDPNFNMTPMVKSFHDQFFQNYSQSFPFQLVPESDIINSEAYKNFVPDTRDRSEANIDLNYTTAEGYKVISYYWGNKNEKDLLKLFNQYDGIMFVFIEFEFQKGIALGGTGTLKVKAHANIVLLNKDDKKVFNIRENATSKKTSVIVGGMPVLKPEKVLPMCESALDELMSDLQKRLPKIIKKSEEKL